MELNELDRPETLMELLEGLPDPRLDHNKRHKLIDLLAIAVLGALSGVDNYVELERFGRVKEKFLRSFLDLPSGIPSHDTFGRLFAALDPVAFRELLARWLSSWSAQLADVQVAIDGKAIRAAIDRTRSCSPLMLVSAFAVQSGLTLGQVRTDPASNEIEAVPRLLEQLKLKGMLVTLDALHCQSDSVRVLHDKGAHYVIAAKGNQPELRKSIDDHFRDKLYDESWRSSADRFLETVEKGHGRIETRRYWLSGELDALELRDLEFDCDDCKWPGVTALGLVERVRQSVRGREPSITRVCYIASLPKNDVRSFASAVRNHWAIENNLHWVLDIAFDEDRSTARSREAGQNYALVRKLALNLIRQERENKVGVKCKRKMCGWDHEYLLQVLKGNPLSTEAPASSAA